MSRSVKIKWHFQLPHQKTKQIKWLKNNDLIILLDYPLQIYFNKKMLLLIHFIISRNLFENYC